jgi:hypothetical protein
MNYLQDFFSDPLSSHNIRPINAISLKPASIPPIQIHIPDFYILETISQIQIIASGHRRKPTIIPLLIRDIKITLQELGTNAFSLIFWCYREGG